MSGWQSRPCLCSIPIKPQYLRQPSAKLATSVVLPKQALTAGWIPLAPGTLHPGHAQGKVPKGTNSQSQAVEAVSDHHLNRGSTDLLSIHLA